MCLLVPGKIIAIENGTATLDYGSETRTGRLIEDGYAVGDYAIIQGGFVIERIDPTEAEHALRSYANALATHRHEPTGSPNGPAHHTS